MNEGEVFNTEALKMSIKRVNQLGYFKQMEKAPDIRPSEIAENKVDVTFKVEEQNRNQFTFGGGVSGYEGAFLNASFSTTNFLGAGETFQIYAQTGKRSKNYSLSVSEPYFLDRPITAGVDLYKRKTIIPPYYNVTGYSQENTGFSLVSGFLVGKWSRAFLNYTYEVIKISEVSAAEFANDPYYSIYGSGAYGTVYNPLMFGDLGRRTESRITPNLDLQHRRQPVHPAGRHAPHRHPDVRRGPARGHGQLLPAEPREHRLPAGRPQDVPRDAGGVRPHRAVRRHEGAAAGISGTSSVAKRRSAATRSAPSARPTPRTCPWAATSSSSSTPSTTSTCSAPCAPCCTSTPARPTSRATG